MTTRVLTTEDASAWEQALPAGLAVFGSLGFARVQEALGLSARLVTVAAAGVQLAYPLLLQPVPAASGAESGVDVSTPPFTGPLLRGEVDDAGAGVLRELLQEALRSLGAVTEFAHIHPWRRGREVLGATGLSTEREVVHVDLSGSEPTRGYSRSCAKNVRRAQSAGVVVREVSDDADLRAFHAVYAATMRRRGALPRYHYDLAYFALLRRELAGHARFVLAELDGEVVAATLYLYDDDDVYSFLGGADMAHQHVRPTNLVIDDTIRWAAGRGRRRLVLGGGYRAGDGIERFKAGFSPLRAALPQLRQVHDECAYERLVTRWRRERGDQEEPDYFPLYRSGAPTAALG